MSDHDAHAINRMFAQPPEEIGITKPNDMATRARNAEEEAAMYKVQLDEALHVLAILFERLGMPNRQIDDLLVDEAPCLIEFWDEFIEQRVPSHQK